MKVINRARQAGKTTDLIKLAAENGGYIVCLNQNECSRIFRQANEMKLNINFPLTFQEFRDGAYHFPGIKEFYIDNANILLQMMSPVRIHSVTLTEDDL